MATMAVPTPAPRTAATAMARRMGGNAKKTSITRPSTWSSPRPTPASRPRVPPATRATRMEAPAIPSETRTPWTIRDNTSRPKRSVPSRWPALGGANICAAPTAVGEYGATRSASAPARTMRPSTTHAPTNSGLRSARRADAGSATAQPRIERGVEEVHGEVQEHEDGAEEEDDPLHDRVVALEDGVQQEPADARQREDVLHDDD